MTTRKERWHQEARERAQQARDLHASGVTWSEIAYRLHYRSASSAAACARSVKPPTPSPAPQPEPVAPARPREVVEELLPRVIGGHTFRFTLVCEVNPYADLLAEIRRQWRMVVAVCRQKSPRVAHALALAEPVALEACAGGYPMLSLHVPHIDLLDRLSALESASAVEWALQQTVEREITIWVAVDRDAQPIAVTA